MILLLRQEQRETTDGKPSQRCLAACWLLHCFDRIVILGHIPLLTRPENIVHFFRDLRQSGPITKDLFRPETGELHTHSTALRHPQMKAHGLVERHGRRYAYRLTDKGNKVALLFVLFHKRVCGPLAHSLFTAPTQPSSTPVTKIEAAYRKADRSIEQMLQLLACSLKRARRRRRGRAQRFRRGQSRPGAAKAEVSACLF